VRDASPSSAPAATAACPACGSIGVSGALNVRGHRFLRCAGCGTLFVVDVPPAAEIERLYAGEEYYVNPDFHAPENGGYHGYRDYFADREHIEAKFEAVLAHVEQAVAPGRLLDVGAGPGFLLAAAERRGWTAIGVDPNGWAGAYARDHVGVDVRTTTLDDTELERGTFDAITFMDVIEHLDDPDPVIERAGELLRPGGVIAILTADAGSPVSRALGVRWPEIQRVPEHLVLYTAVGLSALGRRHGLDTLGWHSIGKRSSIATLVADVSPVAPGVGRIVQRFVDRSPVGQWSFDLDPRTKLCLYARKTAVPQAALPRRVPRLPRRVPAAPVDSGGGEGDSVVTTLRALGRARRLSDWMFAQFDAPRGGRVAEVGAGIGTFSQRLLDAGVGELLVVEPEPASADELERRFAGDLRVRIAREYLPDAPSLAAQEGQFDLVVCQNVLEHIDDDGGAVVAMARALAPGGQLSILVPAHPRLYGQLDAAFGHFRRYERTRLRALLEAADLEVERIYSFNALGVPAWWLNRRRSVNTISSGSLALYDLLVPAWRRIEARLQPPVGLSLIAHARKPRR
jgi:2-polyprenyl-3-methyl-5-hydroxy-6-metoxy-1,4-benzoquinol methylase